MNIEEKYKQHLEKYAQLEDIRRKLWTEDGRSTVSIMVGAGFSRNASKLDSSLKGMSLWRDLKLKLLNELGNNKKYSNADVLVLGDEYEKQFGTVSLENLLKSEIPDENYEPNHLYTKLLELPFSDIYTTNYDTLLERASKNIFNRHYQLIYDIHDISGSVSPRIVKLHGSFPSYRPFVFTKSSYEKYPKESAPFINMVQQSIMETTMILIGFSGDDPNFNKWVEWVSSNLGKHRQKIYLLDLGMDESKHPFSDNLITGINFDVLYSQVNMDNRYELFFDELFEYLSINPNIDKRKWPYKKYKRDINKEMISQELIDILSYNRETYPGWLIMPHRVMKNRYVVNEIISYYFAILNTEENYNLQVKLANELVWMLKNFRIPLDYKMQKSLEEIVFNSKEGQENEREIDILLFLLKEYRLDNNSLFLDISRSIERKTLGSNKQKDELHYQNLLWKKDRNDNEIYKEAIQNWIIDDQALDYKLKKAALLLEINKVDEALNIIRRVLQSARRIQSIDRQNYFALSVEGIALTQLKRYAEDNSREEYFNRIIILDQNFCDPLTTTNYISNFKREVIPSSVEQKRNFDGKRTVSYNMGNYGQSDSSAAFFLMTIYEEYYLGIETNHKIDMLKYFQMLYPIYTLKKFFSVGDKKITDDFFSKESILAFSDQQVEELYVFLRNAIKYDVQKNILLILDVLFRLYFILDENKKNELDSLLISQYTSSKKVKSLGLEAKKIFNMCFSRIFQSKFSEDLNIYINKVYNLPIIGEEGTELEKINLDENFCFDPIQFFNDNDNKLIKVKIISEQYTVSKLLDYLTNSKQPYSVKVGSWQRLLFLYSSNNVSNQEFIQIQKTMQLLLKKNDSLFKNYLKSFVITTFIKDYSLKKIYMDELLENNLRESFSNIGSSIGIGLHYQLLEIRNMIMTTNFQENIYQKIVSKVEIWWGNQYEIIRKNRDVFFRNDDLQEVVVFIKNTIFRFTKKDFFDSDMKGTILQCYISLKEDNNSLSYLLIPGLLKIDIDIDSENLINELISGMLSPEKEIMSNAITAMQDIALFKEQGEISCNVRETKILLLQLFSVQKESSLLDVSKVISLIINEKPNFFTKKELKDIAQKVERFFKMYIINPTQDAFEKEELIDITVNYLNIIKSLMKTKFDFDCKPWIEWCSKSVYPETKKYAYILKEY